MDLWTWSINKLKVTEMKSRVQGVESLMRSFEFIFCSLLGEKIFKQTDNLSRTLQDPTMSAAQGYEVAQIVLKCLKKCQADNDFSNFFFYVRKRSADLDVNEPELPQQRKIPFEYGPTPNHQFTSVEDLFRKLYFDAYDNGIKAIEDRFNQQDFKNYAALQKLICMLSKERGMRSILK